jgi:hypothetical protein
MIAPERTSSGTKTMTKSRGKYSIPSIYPLPERLERRQKIRVSDAARLNAMDEDTYRKHHGHTIRRVTTRLDAVELGDALDIGKD